MKVFIPDTPEVRAALARRGVMYSAKFLVGTEIEVESVCTCPTCSEPLVNEVFRTIDSSRERAGWYLTEDCFQRL